MHLQKDSKKLKNIWLAIDLALVLAVLIMAGVCVYWSVAAGNVPALDYETSMAELENRDAQINEQTAKMQALIDTDLTELANQIELTRENVTAVQAETERIRAQRDDLQTLREDLSDPARIQERIASLRTEYGQAVRQLEEKIMAGESDYKICYLTFDDGPTYQTDKFLDELERLDVYATFFTIGGGIQDQRNVYIRDNCLRREAMAGHTIANHTFSHAYYGPLYVSVDSFMDSVREQDELVYSITGLHTDIVRFPSGSHYARYREETIQALLDEGYQWMDWIANAYDAGGNGYSSGHIAGTVVWQVRHDAISVVLMHDWNVSTLGALEEVVTRLRADNYLFLPLFKESVTNGNCVPKWG